MQSNAVKEILALPERQTVLESLAQLVDDPLLLGFALGGASEGTDELVLNLNVEGLRRAKLLSGFMVTRKNSLGESWLHATLSRIVEQDGVETAASAVSDMQSSSALWDLLERVNPALAQSYWQCVPFLGGRLSAVETERAVRALLDVGRPALALKVLSDHLEDDGPSLSELALT